MKLSLADFYRDMREQRIVLAFLGVFSQEIMVECRNIITDRQQIDQNVLLVLTSVFVELTENILRYSAEREIREGKSRGVGIVVVRETPTSLTVASGNRSTTEAGKKMVDTWAHLNQRSKDELRQMYRDQRRAAREENALGAGLGLIEIARRAVLPVQCDFTPSDDTHGFVSLEITIAK